MVQFFIFINNFNHTNYYLFSYDLTFMFQLIIFFIIMNKIKENDLN